jgi:hypothetical protein
MRRPFFVKTVAIKVAKFHDPVGAIATIDPRPRRSVEEIRAGERLFESMPLLAGECACDASGRGGLALHRHPFHGDQMPCIAATLDTHADRSLERTVQDESIDRRPRDARKRWLTDLGQERGISMEPTILRWGGRAWKIIERGARLAARIMREPTRAQRGQKENRATCGQQDHQDSGGPQLELGLSRPRSPPQRLPESA